MADSFLSVTEDSHPPKATAEVSHSPKATVEVSASMVKSSTSVRYDQTSTHESIVKGAASVDSSSDIKIYPWSNYKVSMKYPVQLSEPFRNSSTDETEMNNTVEAVLLTEIDGSPGILLFQESPGKGWKLPGAVLKYGESETDGLKQALTRMLLSPDANHEVNVYDWEVGECLARFWGNRHFVMDTYVPYPMTGSQLFKKVFIVRLPESLDLFIPILAVLKPYKLQDIHSNLDEKNKLDPVVAGVPLLLSRFSIA